ncbi:MAG: O-antigen ligase family protein [Firmicutes bacterium]|nr:O-antigen ligase family protein [Bacillota bacterium]
MKKLLALLIIMTFTGSSFVLKNFGSFALTAFRLIFLIFVILHLVVGKPAKSNNKKNMNPQFYIRLLIAFFVCDVLTLAQTPNLAKWLNGNIFIVMNVCLMYFVYYYTDTDEDLKFYMKAFVIGALINIIIGIYEFKTQTHIMGSNYLSAYSVNSWEYQALKKAPTALLYNPNNLGVAVLLAIPIGSILFVNKNGKNRLILNITWYILCIYTAFLTGSRGAIIFSVLIALMTLTVSSGNISKKIIIFAVAGVVVYVAMNKYGDFIFEQLRYSGLISKSGKWLKMENKDRYQLISDGWKIAKRTHFMGTGPRTAETMMKTMLGYADAANRSVHNFWIEFLITLGIGGMFCFLLMYARCLIICARNLRKNKNSIPIIISLMTFAVITTIPPTIITLQFVWVIFGYAIALEKLEYNNWGVAENEEKSTESRIAYKQL